jgi:cytochrome bd-type quinol oxidase subunit 2
MNWKIFIGSMIISAIITLLLALPLTLSMNEESQNQTENLHEKSAGGAQVEQAISSSLQLVIVFLIICYCALTGVIYLIMDRYKRKHRS